MSRPVWMLMVLVVALSLPLAAGPAAHAGPDQDAGTLVTFGRSGGLAGVEDQFEIERDGAARAQRGGQEPRDFQVPADEVTRLEAELEASDFPHLRPSCRNDPPIADGYRYEVTYESRTVRCEQDAGPPALQQVIDHLERILADAPA